MAASDSELSFARYALIGVFFVCLVVLERVRPLRRPTQPKARRMLVNFGMAAVGAAAAGAAFSALVLPAAHWADAQGLGLVRAAALPSGVAVILSVLLLDYTLWFWHWLNHHVPLLWRFHAAHHLDVDLDASTALRFHFGELLLSAPYRTAQVVLIGVDVSVLLLWEAALVVSVMFHHSNVRLPTRLEAVLRRLVITPRLHGIHHSVVPREVHSNYGALLTAWDLAHRTHVWGVPQETIVIGLPEVRRAEPLGRALAFPFTPAARRGYRA